MSYSGLYECAKLFETIAFVKAGSDILGHLNVCCC